MLKPVNHIFSYSIRHLELFLKRLVMSSAARPRFILSFFLFLIAISLYSVPHLKNTVSLEDQLDEHLESFHDWQNYKELFATKDVLTLIVLPHEKSGFSAQEACHILLSMNQIASEFEEIDDFQHPFKIRQAVADKLKLSYPIVLASPFLLPPNSHFVLSLLKESPWSQTLISQSTIDLAFSFSIPRNESFNRSLVHHIIDRTEALIPNLKYWAGQVAQEYFSLQALDASNWLNLATILIVFVGLRIFFGSFKAGLIYLSTLLLTMTIIYGGMAILGHRIDPLSVSLFIIITVACLEDFIFISQKQLHSPQSGILIFRELVTPSFFTSFSTMIGFGSLLVSPVASIQKFGLWAALASLIEWLLIFYLLPSLGFLFPFFRNWTNKEKVYFSEKTEKAIHWVPPKFIIAILMIAFVYPFLVRHELTMSQTPTDVFPKNHPYQESLDYPKTSRQWVADAALIFSWKTRT